jgi:hypothetical protein
MVNDIMECVAITDEGFVGILRKQRRIIGDQLIKVMEKVNGDMGRALLRVVGSVRI